MRLPLTSLALLAIVSFPADSQVTGTIIREPLARPTAIRAFALLSPVNPATGRRGQQNLTIQLTGLNTHFAQGVTTLSMGSGIAVISPVTVVSPTSASAVISIDAATPAGSRAVTVTSGAEVVSLGEGFSVTENPDYFGKSCGAAYGSSLGNMSKGMSRVVSGIIDVAGVEDWFTVSAPSGTNVKLTLSGVGAGSEFEVSALASCAGTPLVSTSPGIVPKEIMLPGNGSQYVIRVRASQWKAESSRFTLTLVAE
jgi:hypothetical protein